MPLAAIETLIEITLFARRSLQAKTALYKGLVSNLGGLGIPARDVFIVLHEVPLENWGIRGGVPASEVDLGFKVRVWKAPGKCIRRTVCRCPAVGGNALATQTQSAKNGQRERRSL